MAKKTKQTVPRVSASLRPLREVLGALMHDFTRASVTMDVSQVHWRNVYRSHAALSEFTPSRVRVVSAKASIPVAFADLGQKTVEDSGITPDDIATILPPTLSQPDRVRFGKKIHARLAQESKHRYLNTRLARDLSDVVKQVLPHVDPAKDLDVERVAKLQKDFMDQLPQDQEARVLYRARDLKKLGPEQIIRLEVTLDVE